MRAIDPFKKIAMPGVKPWQEHEGTVVDDNDPSDICRVRVRVPLLFDGIEDTDLPWALPLLNHPVGVRGGGDVKRTGAQYVPKRGTRVCVYFPVENDPSIMVYSCTSPMKTSDVMPEFEVNYPFRSGYRMPNGNSHIVDELTSEEFNVNPGDQYNVAMGDRHDAVTGNYQLLVSADKSAIPSYLSSSPHALAELAQRRNNQVPFSGEGDVGSVYVKADDTVKLVAGKKFIIECDEFIVKSRTTKMESSGRTAIKSTQLDLN